MLKRNIAILIAAGLLSAQAGLAVADPNWGGFPEGADQYQYWKPWGAQEKYFAERAARDPNPTGGPSPVYPVTTSTRLVASPELIKYFAERTPRGPMGVAGGVFNDGCLKNHPG